MADDLSATAAALVTGGKTIEVDTIEAVSSVEQKLSRTHEFGLARVLASIFRAF